MEGWGRYTSLYIRTRIATTYDSHINSACIVRAICYSPLLLFCFLQYDDFTPGGGNNWTLHELRKRMPVDRNIYSNFSNSDYSTIIALGDYKQFALETDYPGLGRVNRTGNGSTLLIYNRVMKCASSAMISRISQGSVRKRFHFSHQPWYAAKKHCTQNSLTFMTKKLTFYPLSSIP